MKEKYLVCEIHYGKLLGGSVYNTEEDAQHAFCTNCLILKNPAL